MLHDDWGTQNGPFFSLETAMEFFVPPMKIVVDFCHDNGIIFEHHCCGKAESLVPAMAKVGTDYWFPQQAINDLAERRAERNGTTFDEEREHIMDGYAQASIRAKKRRKNK
jgi:uroporphyrinogen-III decarboxylase